MSRMSGRTILFLLILVLAAPSGAMAGGGDPVDVPEHSRAKIGSELAAAIDAGVPVVEAILTGEPHDGVTIDGFASRADFMDELEAHSAPLFERVRIAAERLGGEVVNHWAAAPAIKVRGPAVIFETLGTVEGITSIGLDRRDAVRIVDPLPDTGIGTSNTEGRQMLQAEDIWALGFKGDGIKIAIVDTGLDPRHEAFKFADGSTRVLAFNDTISGDPDAFDDHGHGTHVGGTALGTDEYDDPSNGKFEEVGVAPESELLVSKFLSGGGSGSWEDAIIALQWSFDNGADITSNSWGGGCSDAATSVVQTVHELTDGGMLSVFAAGNSGPGSQSVLCPGSGDAALTVGAVDASENIAGFSSRGPCEDPYLDNGMRICPDVVAKGVSVRSSIPRDSASYADASGYKVWQGTSMATPHIAGAVALAEQMKRFYTSTGWDTEGRAEEEIFKLTAKDLGDGGEDDTFGWGLPQLLSIYSVLNAPDEANIIDTFKVAKSIARLGETQVLTFIVRNFGKAIATGNFKASLINPDGSETVLKETTPSLGLLDAEVVREVMPIDGDVAPGNYTFKGHFDWVDANGGSGSIDREASFEVRRVFVKIEVSGYGDTALPVVPQLVTIKGTNTGTDDATSVTLLLFNDDDYQYAPGTNFTPTDLDSRYANPTPDAAIPDSIRDRQILVFFLGALPIGDSFEVTTNLVATLPDPAYHLQAVVVFRDPVGNEGTQEVSLEQGVII